MNVFKIVTAVLFTTLSISVSAQRVSYCYKGEWSSWEDYPGRTFKNENNTNIVLKTPGGKQYFAFNITNFKIVSVLCSSAILACESLISLSNHQSNWTQYRTTAETLRHEKYMYQTQTGVYKNEEDKFALLVERCETIISSENINWANLQTDTSKRKESGK